MLDNTISRREFLKRAGIAGAALGATGGLGGLLAACGNGETTTTTGAAETTTTAAGASTTTTAAAETTTSASAGAEAGRALKIGFVSPLTGKLANFGIPDKYCVDRWNEYAKDGIVCGDKKNHPIQIIVQDSQSSTDRAFQVAGDLINNDGIDMMMVASTPDTTVPVADQSEAYGVACFSAATSRHGWYPFVLKPTAGG